MLREEYLKSIRQHYMDVWGSEPARCLWDKGPVHELPEGFCVLRFAAGRKNGAWRYVTCGMLA